MHQPARVRLRDVALDDLELLDAWDRPEIVGEFNDFGMPRRNAEALREAVAKGPLRNDRNGMVMIERIADAAPIGTIGWFAVKYGPNDASRAWNMGISLIPDARGQGFGAEAQRLMAEELFQTTDANRVEASTDVENIAEQRSLEKAGFTREGIARGSQFRAGQHHDLMVYSRLRSDP